MTKIKQVGSVVSDSKNRVILILAGIVVLALILGGIYAFRSKMGLGESTAAARLNKIPKVESTPGLDQATESYIRLQEEDNARNVQTAFKKGKSSIPTLSRQGTRGEDFLAAAEEADKNAPAEDEDKCDVDSLRKARLAGVSAKELHCRGCSAAALMAAGYTAGELKSAGYTANQLKDAGFSSTALREAGYSARDLRKAGFSATELVEAGFDASELREAGFNAKDLRSAGFSAKELRAAGFSAEELKTSGFSVEELAEAGYSAAELRKAGFSAAQLREAGFSAEALAKAGFSSKDLLTAGFSQSEVDAALVAAAASGTLSECAPRKLAAKRASGVLAQDLKHLGCSLKELKAAGYSAGELRDAGYTAAQLRAAGFTLGELKDAGFSARELREAGFTAAELLAAGFSVKELKEAGFSIAELRAAGIDAARLKSAGYSVEELRQAGFSAKELRSAGFSADDLKSAGFSVGELKSAGYSAEELRKAGFSATELRKAGFTAEDLKEAGFPANSLLKAGFTKGDLVRAGYKGVLDDQKPMSCSIASLKQARSNNVPAKELKDKGCSADALLAAGYTRAELMAAGYQFSSGSCNVAELKKERLNGVSAKDIRKRGCSAESLRMAGYTAKELKTAGFSAETLRAIGYSADDLRKAGFDARQLQAAGFSNDELKKAGFSDSELSPAPPVAANDDDEEARLRALAARKAGELTDQQREEQVLKMSQAMSSQASGIFSSWAPPPSQQLTVGADLQTDKSSAVAGFSAAPGGATAPAGPPGSLAGGLACNVPVAKAGSVMFAVLDTGVNSDEESPIMATIVQGKFRGAKLLGEFKRVESRVVLSFKTMSLPALQNSVALNAVAIDENTARTALASDVNNHYMLRYGTLFASSFLTGMSQAISQSGAQVTNPSDNNSGNIWSVTSRNLNPTEKTLVALGQVGTQFATALAKHVNTPPTVTVNAGTGLGILFMNDLVLPCAQ